MNTENLVESYVKIGEHTIPYYRIDNDMYGNPRYLVAIMYRNNHLYIEMKGYRKRKDYKYQLQSYNIDEDVQKLAEDFVRNHTAFN